MQPRYRKLAPEVKKFASPQEQNDFMRGFKDAEQALFVDTKKKLQPYGFTGINHEGFSITRAEGLEKLLGKIEKFCPHFSTTMPTFRHFLFPSIGVGCCNECLTGFVPLLMADAAGCDLCGVGGEKDMYVEISIPLGFGSLSMNLGAYCCADIFTK